VKMCLIVFASMTDLGAINGFVHSVQPVSLFVRPVVGFGVRRMPTTTTLLSSSRTAIVCNMYCNRDMMMSHCGTAMVGCCNGDATTARRGDHSAGVAPHWKCGRGSVTSLFTTSSSEEEEESARLNLYQYQDSVYMDLWDAREKVTDTQVRQLCQTFVDGNLTLVPKPFLQYMDMDDHGRVLWIPIFMVAIMKYICMGCRDTCTWEVGWPCRVISAALEGFGNAPDSEEAWKSFFFAALIIRVVAQSNHSILNLPSDNYTLKLDDLLLKKRRMPMRLATQKSTLNSYPRRETDRIT
jgi:hypothetical protein